MIPIEVMHEYVHGADSLAEAQAEIAKWEAVASPPDNGGDTARD